ncbi:hypothetical protein SAMN05216553_108438 [Lentzea fradiae]|uniref:Uncharacterized protein n=1 Tax=Lentzea fradiae TaxID=200378 RepID=A0A1G7UVL3_9PSEU|nr:hypothetical protein SAMN05216553_108438 [Lentzea fradiae]
MTTPVVMRKRKISASMMKKAPKSTADPIGGWPGTAFLGGTRARSNAPMKLMMKPTKANMPVVRSAFALNSGTPVPDSA